jgi:imidazolonepropionase-like amidohydrolase
MVLAPAISVMAEDEVLAIKAGKVLPISGEPIADGIILIRDGKIAAIGPKVRIPDDTSVIDATDRVAMPGLVDARALHPIRGDLNEQSREITPGFRISLAIDPNNKELKHSLQSGTTTLYVPPGANNLIAGFGAVVKPVGKTASELIIRDEAALHLIMGSDSTRGNRTPRSSRPDNFYYRRPTTRMAVAWMLRKSFFDAQQYAKSHEEHDPALEILSAGLKDEIPVRVTVRRAIDIRTVFRIADEYGLRIILDECTEGYKVAELIAEKQAPVVLGPFYYYPRTSSQYREGEEVNWNNAGILAKAGVKVALASGAESQTRSLLSVATFAVRHGMPRDEAIRGVTLTAAEILGVADRVGSLEKGKDADVLILNGDPLAATSRIQRVILKGQTVHQDEQ